MTAALMATDGLEYFRCSAAPALRGRVDVEDLAALPDWVIAWMTARELAHLLRSARGAFLRSEIRDSLELCSETMLRRLVFLIRRSCRNQLSAQLPVSTASPNGVHERAHGCGSDWNRHSDETWDSSLDRDLRS